MGPLPSTLVQSTTRCPLTAPILAPVVPRRCWQLVGAIVRGWEGKQRGRKERKKKKKRRASAVSCAWMPQLRRGGRMLGTSLPQGALGGRRHVKWVKRPWVPGSRRAGGLGGLAGLGRFPPCCRLGEWTWQIPALACQAKPFPMRPDVAGARIRDACRTGPQLRFRLSSRERGVLCVL